MEEAHAQAKAQSDAKYDALAARFDALSLQTQPTASNTNYSTDRRGQPRFAPTDPPVKCVDTSGRTWHQLCYYCSKHGANTSHSNDNCRDGKGKPGWTAGAHIGNRLGGSDKLVDKFNHWYQRKTNTFSSTKPT